MQAAAVAAQVQLVQELQLDRAVILVVQVQLEPVTLVMDRAVILEEPVDQAILIATPPR